MRSLSRGVSRHWLPALVGMNLSSIMASGRLFWVMLFFTCFQHFIFFLVWIFFFYAVRDIQGWGLSEVALLQGLFGISLGVMSIFLGGLDMLALQIQSGEMDVHLARPRAVLPSAVCSHTRIAALGDVVYGVAVIALFGNTGVEQLPVLGALLASVCTVFVAFKLLLHSLAFWGLSAYAADGGVGLLYVSATKPINGFGVWGKVLLLTVLPAGYIALLPVEILRDFRFDLFIWQVGASAGLLLLAVRVFYRGLRRYASGSQFVMLR